VITAAAILTATLLRTLLTIAAVGTMLLASDASVTLGALTVAAKRLTGGAIEAIALQLTVDAIETGRAICQRVALALSFLFLIFRHTLNEHGIKSLGGGIRRGVVGYIYTVSRVYSQEYPERCGFFLSRVCQAKAEVRIFLMAKAECVYVCVRQLCMCG